VPSYEFLAYGLIFVGFLGLIVYIAAYARSKD
jgi:preprotein translocase subunit Sss1